MRNCGLRLLFQVVILGLTLLFVTFQVLLSRNKTSWKGLALRAIPNILAAPSSLAYLDAVKNLPLLSSFEVQNGGLNRSKEFLKDTPKTQCNNSLLSRKVTVEYKDAQFLKVTYSHLMDVVYNRVGFVEHPTCRTKPWLFLVHWQQFKPGFCAKVFQNWLDVNNNLPLLDCPEEIPEDFAQEFSLFSTHKVGKYILNNIKMQPTKRTWNAGTLKNHMDIVKIRGNFYYGDDTKIVYTALENVDLKDKKIATIGSEQPWLEAILLSKAVGSITLMEYEYIQSEIDSITYIHPKDVAEEFLLNPTSERFQFDAIVSFGTLMVSGTGRYGDVIDPWADVREMMKSWCMLKTGGVVLFGVPQSLDQLVWNAQRHYGPIRLPLMTAGFEVLKVFTSGGVLAWENLGDEEWLYPNGQTQYIVMARKVTS